jgi:futalosine hydrolase
MKILIAAATEMEMDYLKKSFSNNKMLQMEYCVTGIGAISTTFHLQKTIISAKPDLVIQVGLAGAFSELLPIGKAFAVKKEIVAEMGVFENEEYKDIFNLGLEKRDAMPYSDGTLINENESILECSKLEIANAITVNEISTSIEKIDLFKNHYHAAIESMEGAALHYVCIMNQIPFIQIRGISNMVGVRDKRHWEIKKAMQAAIEGTQNVLSYMEKTLDR